jgi:DNA-binding IclR family transcriptional regulator
MAVKDTDAAGGVQVIARAAQVFRALEAEPLGLSVAQLADRVGLPRSTVYRIVTALATEGLLASTSSSGRVQLGPEFARLAMAGSTELWRPAVPYMQRLADELGETVDCAVMDGSQVRVLHVIPTTRHTLRAIAEVGQAFAAYSSSKGKALLAEYEPKAAMRMLPATFEQLTPYTRATPAELAEDLAQARETGIAYSREESALGVCGAAIAVRMPSGVLLAISVVVPSQRYTHLEPKISQALREVRRDARQALTMPQVPVP